MKSAKRLLSFINDTFVIVGLLVVTLVAFLATYALSPVPFEKSILAQAGTADTSQRAVLGESDQPVEFQDIFEKHDYFDVEPVSVNGNYTAGISLGPVSKGEISKDIVAVSNPSGHSKKVTVKLSSAESEVKSSDIAILVDGREYKFNRQFLPGAETDVGNQTENGALTTSVSISANSSKKIGIKLTNPQNIHYAINFELRILTEN